MILLASKSKPKRKVKAALKNKAKKNKASNRKIPAKISNIKKSLNKRAKPVKKSARKIKKPQKQTRGTVPPELKEEEILDSGQEYQDSWQTGHLEEEQPEEKKEGKLTGFFSRIFKKNEVTEENVPEDMKADSEFLDLEKQISELGSAFEKKKSKGLTPLSSIPAENNPNKKQQEIEAKNNQEKKSVFSFFNKKTEVEAEQEKEEPLKQDIQEIAEKKSKNFVKCQEMISKANSFLQNNDDYKAKDLYLKARELYLNLEFSEKKDIYKELMQLYNKIS